MRAVTSYRHLPYGTGQGWMPMSGFVIDLSAGGVLRRPVALTWISSGKGTR